MPELPEVETVRRQLEQKILNKKIVAVDIRSSKQVSDDFEFERKLIGNSFSNIDRIGKLMIFSFNESNYYMTAHLKMTGQFFVINNDREIFGGGHSIKPGLSIDELPNKHTRVIIELQDVTSLMFNDLRKFGYLKVVEHQELTNIKKRFGLEPIDSDFTTEYLYQKTKKTRLPIKSFLLDQSKVAGLGNIYVDEVLWLAKINPKRKSKSLSKNEVKRIANFSRQVLTKSIKIGGTTFRDFADTGGKEGNYIDYLKVFTKDGQPCQRCNELVIKEKFRGRGTHYCPNCQT